MAPPAGRTRLSTSPHRKRACWRGVGGGFLLPGKSKKLIRMICFPINATLEHADMLLFGFTFDKTWENTTLDTKMFDHWATCLKSLWTSQAGGTPYAQTSQDHNLGPFLTLTQTPYAPAAFPRTLCRVASLRCKVEVCVAIPGGGFNEKSQGLWCIWYTSSFVSWKTKTDFKVLLPWSKKTSVRLSQTACATTTDQPYIVEQSTFSRPPNSITAFWITIYLDGS